MRAKIRDGDWRWPATLIVGLSALVMGAILFWIGRWLTIWLDEWDFIFWRQTLTPDSFLTPHVDAFVLVPASVYHVLLNTLGLSSYYPFLIADWLAHFACVVLLGIIVTRTAGVLVGMMAALSLLFLGSAFEALLQPFQMQYLFGAAGGLLAVLALDRQTRRARHYALATLALMLAIASSAVGPLMAGMVLVWALLRRDRPAVLVAALALGAYVIWYLGWLGSLSRVAGAAENLPLVPLELLFGLGAAVSGVIGLPPARFAWLGVAAGAALISTAWWRGLRPSPLAIAAVLALVAEYGLQALFRGALGLEHGARSAYLYPAAIFIWLTVAGALGGRLDPRRWTGGRRLAVPALVGLLIVPMALGNMAQFFLAARAMEPLRATELRELGLMVRLRATPGLDLDVAPDPALMPQVTARQYFAAIDRFGTPTIVSATPADDLPGPDASALNALALRLLGGAINSGSPGAPGPSAPVLDVARGSAALDDVPACTLLRTSSGTASATWSPRAAGVAIRADGPAQLNLSAGLFEPADAPLDSALREAIERGDTIWLPVLPRPFSWTLTLDVTGNVPVHVCSLE